MLERVAAERRSLPPLMLAAAAEQIRAGMEAICSAGYLHRDLSLRNVLCFAYNLAAGTITVKVCDFGRARPGPVFVATDTEDVPYSSWLGLDRDRVMSTAFLGGPCTRSRCQPCVPRRARELQLFSHFSLFVAHALSPSPPFPPLPLSPFPPLFLPCSFVSRHLRCPGQIPESCRIRWTAPETLLSNTHTEASEVWAFGVTVRRLRHRV